MQGLCCKAIYKKQNHICNYNTSKICNFYYCYRNSYGYWNNNSDVETTIKDRRINYVNKSMEWTSAILNWIMNIRFLAFFYISFDFIGHTTIFEHPNPITEQIQKLWFDRLSFYSICFRFHKRSKLLTPESIMVFI